MLVCCESHLRACDAITGLQLVIAITPWLEAYATAYRLVDFMDLRQCEG